MAASRNLTDAQRSLRGRAGAHALHAKHDSRVTSAPGRAAFLARFEREVDPDGVLPVAERVRRAEHAKKAYFASLALKSAAVRRKNRKLSTSASASSTQAASAVQPAGGADGAAGGPERQPGQLADASSDRGTPDEGLRSTVASLRPTPTDRHPSAGRATATSESSVNGAGGGRS